MLLHQKNKVELCTIFLVFGVGKGQRVGWVAGIVGYNLVYCSMSKGCLAVKVLRQNFIKKHQVHPNYFTQGERQPDEDAFCDRQMFYPKEFLRKNNHQGHGRLLPVRKKQEEFKQAPSINLQIKSSQKKVGLKLFRKSLTPSLTPRQEGGHCVSIYSTIPAQPSYIKAEKMRRKVVSAREDRRSLPKYSAYIMKPCSVAPAKMALRPQTALSRKKNQQLNRYMGFGLKRQVQGEKLRGQTYLLPWQTEQFDQL